MKSRLISDVRRRASSMAYSAPVRGLARVVVASPKDSRVRRFVEGRELDGTARRLASEALPPGMYFAKLTIHDWEQFEGRSFRLLQNGRVVYGNEIEPPAKGHPLEYRNIMVTSNRQGDFSLDLETTYKLQIGQGAFSTPQQVRYDEQYGVVQHGDVFYSVRGNTRNPKKLLLTFPGFGPSTSRISYAVSYLKALTDEDLKDTLMVCFQDRYQVAGTYMMVDNAGRPLYERVKKVIDGMVREYSIDPADILFFGASKGGSIAIHYAQEFPAAHLLLAVPQMHLPYYFTKPFFKENLFRVGVLHDLSQPGDLLRSYLEEGRQIDYFYTNSDELSNHSLIELAQGVDGLTKYRFDGVHGAVARAALPATLGVIRRFLGRGRDLRLTCEEIRSFVDDASSRVQVRVGATEGLPSEANWFIGGYQGQTRFLQVLTDHAYGFVKYSSEGQRLMAFDRVAALDSVVAMDASGDRWTGALPGPVESPGDRELPWGPLCMDTGGCTRDYVILDGDTYDSFRYRASNVGDGDTLEIHVVDDLGGREVREVVAPSGDGTSHVVDLQLVGSGVFVHLMLLRLLLAARASHLRVIVHAQGIDTALVVRAGQVAWDSVVVEVRSPLEVHGSDAEHGDLGRLEAAGRVVLS